VLPGLLQVNAVSRTRLLVGAPYGNTTNKAHAIPGASDHHAHTSNLICFLALAIRNAKVGIKPAPALIGNDGEC
jgi:hypothetical protein